MKKIINYIKSLFTKTKIEEETEEYPLACGFPCVPDESLESDFKIIVDEDILEDPLKETVAGCPANYEAINSRNRIKVIIKDYLDNQIRIETDIANGNMLSITNRKYVTDCIAFRIKKNCDNLIEGFEKNYNEKYYT